MFALVILFRIYCNNALNEINESLRSFRRRVFFPRFVQ